MDSPTTSFIPKKTFTANPNPSRRPDSSNFFGVIAFAVLALALVFLAGAFIFQYWLYNKIYSPCSPDGKTACGLQASLTRDRQSLGFENLERAKRIEIKTTRGQTLINNHISVAPIFRQALNSLTIDNVGYQSFKFNPKGVTILGSARSYEDVAYQAQVFKDQGKGKITSFNFYDLDLDQNGNVVFKLDMTLDPSILSFKNQTF